ncbi:restriction endonuclease subunit M [Bradyrhizobium canariense]|uniref:restriction endonuclease subunit M n=1 Tax=Bradyrhizobium canariense TaxID=255045 RepID=UPI00117899B8|nr:N-6 DNA methylase [Bradyrhizobium canariense]
MIDETGQGDDGDIVPEGMLVCALTGDHKPATAQEETLQSLIEQLHGEYGIPLNQIKRDVRVQCVSEEAGKERNRTRVVSLAVYESDAAALEDIVRVVIVAKPTAKSNKSSIDVLDEVLGNLSQDRSQVFGIWTNGIELSFRMRTFHKRTGTPEFTDLTDIPALDESLEELETADRRPLRVASGDSLLRTFRRCHDYLYGNQNMRGDRAFWQILYLIFAKILDERSSAREFFVGATERNSEKGQREIAKRIKQLFARVKEEYDDVFDGNEEITLNDRALSFIAAELSRYSFLNTDTDAKGTAYEAITSTTLKRERGQFFTPRNVIKMMVDMIAPTPDKKVLDPACGSGGFLVVVLSAMRQLFLLRNGCPYPENPIPSELKKIDPSIRKYAGSFLYGVDVDPELRKAARMNMVMNNDGHGNIYSFNSLEFGIPKFASPEQVTFSKKSGGGHGQFDYVVTNPPFGAKIPVEDPDILRAFELGYTWKRSGDAWTKRELQKKVPPEILFIETCWKFLKPGTGVAAIVLPNGILGNPGEQMEFVRWWMLRHMELLASVDLPAEAFLPQVSVQASCVFLRRRADNEIRLAGSKGPPQRPVFMAISENCGHGRRGEVQYVRNPDGTEKIQTRTVVERRERNRKIDQIERLVASKEVADDLPWIAQEYHRLCTQATEK